MMKRVLGSMLTLLLLGAGTVAQAGGGTTKLSPLDWPIKEDFSLLNFNHHRGVDLLSTKDAQVYPVAAGEVKKAGCRGKNNTHCRIVLQHTDNGVQFRSIYAHLKNSNVTVGQQLDTQTVLGLVSTQRHDKHYKAQPHVHFELRFKDASPQGKYVLADAAYYMEYFE